MRQSQNISYNTMKIIKVKLYKFRETIYFFKWYLSSIRIYISDKIKCYFDFGTKFN